MTTLNFTILARFANIKVEMLSCKYYYYELMVANSLVLQLPPIESFKKNVSLESRNGIYFLFLSLSMSAFTTLPKALKDLLMLHPYFSLKPYTPVSFIRSLPAKSTTLIFVLINLDYSFSCMRPSIFAVNILCDLEDSVFIEVHAIVLFLFPLANNPKT